MEQAAPEEPAGAGAPDAAQGAPSVVRLDPQDPEELGDAGSSPANHSYCASCPLRDLADCECAPEPSVLTPRRRCDFPVSAASPFVRTLKGTGPAKAHEIRHAPGSPQWRGKSPLLKAKSPLVKAKSPLAKAIAASAPHERRLGFRQ